MAFSLSTSAEHKKRETARRWRHARRAKELLGTAWIILRPFALPFVALGGLYIAIEELKQSPVHHNTTIWVLGLGIAGLALAGCYKEIRNRILFRRWMETDDPAELQMRLPDVKKAVPSLPPWYRSRYVAKKQELEQLPSKRYSHAPHSVDDGERVGIAARSLGHRLRNSASFVLSVLVLGAVGAVAFVQWLQLMLSGLGNPVPWLVVWVIVGLYLTVFGSIALMDSRRRRSAAAGVTDPANVH